MNILEQVDDFWREGIKSGVTNYDDFIKRLQDQVSHLPQEEQDRLFNQVADRNTEYLALAERDNDALRVRLGLPAYAVFENSRSAAVQVDDFWRECLQSGQNNQTKYADLIKRIQGQVSHWPQAEQDKLFMLLIDRNTEYIALMKRDRDALRARLGLPVSSPTPINTGRLAQVAADTVVRATIWQSIAALFRAFR
ncbi:hypothetical protein [Bradyrhizobium sp. USDA 4518]